MHKPARTPSIALLRLGVIPALLIVASVWARQPEPAAALPLPASDHAACPISWSRRAPMPTARSRLGVAERGDRIYAVGGQRSFYDGLIDQLLGVVEA